MKDNYVQTCTSSIIEELGENFYSFKSECSCFSHDIEVQLDKSSDGIIELSLYDDVYIGEDYECSNILEKILFRLKCAWKCLFSDGFEIEHAFVFKGEEHLRQFQQYFNERCNEILKKPTNKHFKRTYKKRKPFENNKNQGNIK
jgi:hypothetical protein